VAPSTRDDVEPLSADLRRLHVTVSRQLLKKLEAAREGLSHARPGATTDQVIEAALDLLLEKQARARGLVKRPRSVVAVKSSAIVAANPVATSTATPKPISAPAPTPGPTRASQGHLTQALPSAPFPASAPSIDAIPTPTDPPPPSFTAPRHRRPGPRARVPAAIFRAVWQRDGGRCSWPLDGGGVCGSTHLLELDHLVPWARWGGETVDDLRIVCHAHNALAAREAFGERCMARYTGSRPGA